MPRTISGWVERATCSVKDTGLASVAAFRQFLCGWIEKSDAAGRVRRITPDTGAVYTAWGKCTCHKDCQQKWRWTAAAASEEQPERQFFWVTNGDHGVPVPGNRSIQRQYAENVAYLPPLAASAELLSQHIPAADMPSNQARCSG